MADYLITDTQMTAIADAVRKMRYETGKLTPEQIVTKIQSSLIGTPSDIFSIDSHVDENGHWIRPEEYPNLDLLYETIDNNESCVYLTYDLTKTPGYGWIGVYVGGSTYAIERGHISNGVFVSDYSSGNLSANTIFRQNLDSANGNVQLWKISSSGNLTSVRFTTNTTTNANNYYNNLQPCVERVGKLPYATGLSSSNGVTSSYYSFGTEWLERDRLLIATKSVVTSLSNMYALCRSLRETNCAEWNTSEWKVTNINSMFDSCYRLRKLDLSHWDTSNWTVTSINYAWSCCFSLEYLDVSTWNTKKWHPSSLDYTFYNCISLKELDLSNWDTSIWTITTMRSAWAYMYCLRKLDISTWDTSNWAVVNMQSVWNGCYSLIELPIGNWDVSNWTVNYLSYAWSACYSLQNLPIGNWNVSNWRPSSLESTWGSCYMLRELPIENWNVSDWVVTSLSGTWGSLHNLQSLNLNKWDVSNWRVTTCYAMFYACWSLKELKIDQWDVSDWPVTDFSRVFYYCYNLEEIDLTSWNVSNWAVTTVYYLFNSMWYAKKIDIHNWDVSNWSLTEARYLYGSNYTTTLLLPTNLYGTVTNSKYTANLSNLVNFHGPSLDINQNYSNSRRLTHESLVTLINELPTVSDTKTLTLGQTNRLKLTAAEIAVATQKGWTVA